MDNLDTLSDDELRRRLMQFGFPNLPVTSTTRSILVKKLRNYMETEKSKLRRETSYATRYSSDEEASDREQPGGRRGRATIATVSQTNNFSGMPPPKRISTVTSRPAKQPTLSPRRTVYVSPPIHRHQDTDEDSDTTSFSSPILPSNRVPVLSKTYAEYSYGGRNSSYRTPVDAAGPSGATNGHAAEDSPYLSEFTKRLLNLRGTTVSESRKLKILDGLQTHFRCAFVDRTFRHTNSTVIYIVYTFFLIRRCIEHLKVDDAIRHS